MSIVASTRIGTNFKRSLKPHEVILGSTWNLAMVDEIKALISLGTWDLFSHMWSRGFIVKYNLDDPMNCYKPKLVGFMQIRLFPS